MAANLPAEEEKPHSRALGRKIAESIIAGMGFGGPPLGVGLMLNPFFRKPSQWLSACAPWERSSSGFTTSLGQTKKEIRGFLMTVTNTP